jgi:hypothetical protein
MEGQGEWETGRSGEEHSEDSDFRFYCQTKLIITLAELRIILKI